MHNNKPRSGGGKNSGYGENLSKNNASESEVDYSIASGGSPLIKLVEESGEGVRTIS